MSDTLDPTVRDAVYTHGREGREAWQRGDLGEAERQFLLAWRSLPEPRTSHDLAQSMSVALVKFHRDAGAFDKAHAWLDIARQAYGQDPASDAHLGFLLGTVCYASGATDQAREAFARLHAEHGTRPFRGEDPKYLDFLLGHS